MHILPEIVLYADCIDDIHVSKHGNVSGINVSLYKNLLCLFGLFCHCNFDTCEHFCSYFNVALYIHCLPYELQSNNLSLNEAIAVAQNRPQFATTHY